MPDAQRALAAATQELLELLAQSPEGRQTLGDLGFQLFLEDIERKTLITLLPATATAARMAVSQHERRGRQGLIARAHTIKSGF